MPFSGTASEANSLTLDERRRVIDAHIEAGIPAGCLLPRTGGCAIDDVVTLTRHAGEPGVAAVLLLPPFFYKNVSDNGLFEFVAQVTVRTLSHRCRSHTKVSFQSSSRG